MWGFIMGSGADVGRWIKNEEVPVPLENLIVDDFRKLNRKERKLVYHFIRAVASQNKEAIDFCVSVLHNA